MRLLEAFDLYRFYHANEEETLALRGVSLHIDAGEIVVVMGPSGSGKSTLLSCLAGLDEPDGGFVNIMGQRITRRSEAERAKMRASEIGLMLQSRNLFEHLTVSDNIRFQMKLSATVKEDRLRTLLDTVGLADKHNMLPSRLSGGQAARASLAVALSSNPNMLIADEPTSEVDSETEQRLIELFEQRRSSGAGTLIATHSKALASRADRVLSMVDGRLQDE